jgi:hypothetical protein
MPLIVRLRELAVAGSSRGGADSSDAVAGEIEQCLVGVNPIVKFTINAVAT